MGLVDISRFGAGGGINDGGIPVLGNTPGFGGGVISVGIAAGSHRQPLART